MRDTYTFGLVIYTIILITAESAKSAGMKFFVFRPLNGKQK
jgi:hypothetical protein